MAQNLPLEKDLLVEDYSGSEMRLTQGQPAVHCVPEPELRMGNEVGVETRQKQKVNVDEVTVKVKVKRMVTVTVNGKQRVGENRKWAMPADVWTTTQPVIFLTFQMYQLLRL